MIQNYCNCTHKRLEEYLMSEPVILSIFVHTYLPFCTLGVSINPPATLYQLAPLVMPSAKYSPGYRLTQGCPLCIRGFSCKCMTTHTRIKKRKRKTQSTVARPCLINDLLSQGGALPLHFTISYNKEPQVETTPAGSSNSVTCE